MRRPISYLLFCLMIPLVAADIPTVTNGRQPLGSAYTLAMEEDLHLGPDTGDNYIWPGTGTGVVVNDAGHIFIVQPTENSIIELDNHGVFVRQVAGPGQGPGELQALVSFQFLADGTAIALENRGPLTTFNYFTKELVYRDKKTHNSLTMILRLAVFAPDASHLAGTYVSVTPATGQMVIHGSLLNSELDVLEERTSVKRAAPNPQKLNDPAYWSEMLAEEIKYITQGNLLFATFDREGNCYTATGRHYKITRWDGDLKQTMVITRDYKPIVNTDEEIAQIIDPVVEAIRAQLPPAMKAMITHAVVEKAIELAEIPAAKLAIYGLNTIDGDKILVTHDNNLLRKEALLDIFDKSGAYLGKFTHPIGALGITPPVFKNGLAYMILPNAEGENELFRYRYRLVSEGSMVGGALNR